MMENSSSIPTLESQTTSNVALDIRHLSGLVFFFVITLVSLVGNGLSLAVFTCSRLRDAPSNGFLVALAVADIGSALTGAIFNSTGVFDYIPNAVECHYITYLEDVFITLSAWFVVCFTIERYISVCHPLHPRRNLFRLRQRYVVILISVLSAAMYAGRLVPTQGAFDANADYYTACENPNGTAIKYYMHTYTVLRFASSFALPCLLILILNSLIICGLRRHSRNSHLDTGVQEERRAQSMSITRTLLLISLFFFVCICPHHVYIIVDWIHGDYLPDWIFIATVVLFRINYSCNFFVYVFSGARFRSALAELLGVRCTRANSTRRHDEQQQDVRQ